MTSSEATEADPADVAALATRVGRTIGLQATPAARVGLVCGWFNGGITTRLLRGALDALDHSGAQANQATVAWVPGAFELPLAAQRMAGSEDIDAVVALGAVIRGETAHFDFVAGACAHGLARVGLTSGKPVIFGVLTTDTVDQALARCQPGPANKGFEAAMGALQMVWMLRELGQPGPVRPGQPAPSSGRR